MEDGHPARTGKSQAQHGRPTGSHNGISLITTYLVLLTKYRVIAGVLSSRRRIGVRRVCGNLSIRRIFEDVRKTGVTRRS